MIKYILILFVLLSCREKKVEKHYSDGEILIVAKGELHHYEPEPCPTVYRAVIADTVYIHDTVYITKVRHDTVYAQYFQDLGIDTVDWNLDSFKLYDDGILHFGGELPLDHPDNYFRPIPDSVIKKFILHE